MAAMFFFKALRRQGNPGYAYMKNRGISEETLNSFGIGYADDSWTASVHSSRAKVCPMRRCWNWD